MAYCNRLKHPVASELAVQLRRLSQHFTPDFPPRGADGLRPDQVRSSTNVNQIRY